MQAKRWRKAALLLLAAAPLAAGAQRDVVLDGGIRTLRAYVQGRPTAPPVIELGGGEHIVVDFDQLSHDCRRYLYRVEHCDAEWRTSEHLFESDYLTGSYVDKPIDDYRKSFNTTQLYTHYALRLPNPEVGFALAGNYRVTILDDTGEEPRPVARAHFTVVNTKATLTATASTDTDIDRNDRHQQLTVRLGFGQLPVRDARRELSIVVMQNRRLDNAAVRPAPTSAAAGALLWEHARQLIFEAGNEYRKFELLSTRRGGLGVDNVRWFEPYYHATLYADEPRRNYLYDEDQDGIRVVRTTDGEDADTETDYAFVHFALSTPRRDDGDFYVEGSWTGNRLDPEWRMDYDEAAGCYTAAPLLKLGYYSYHYLFVPHASPGRGLTSPAEGDFYQTENEYTIIAYYAGQGTRYEEPVAALTFKYSPQ